ncbi:MAG: hypothetical protein RLZ33_1642 [Bacteroidota bacterium]|jgi:RNAse (barnase) inhibitor barstar
MYTAEIDCKGINSKLDLMKAFDKAFDFPPYFGENWDALWDCMRDMYWINDSEIKLQILNINSLIGKLKSEVITFLEDLKNHLNKSENNLNSKVHFDYELINLEQSK